MKAEELMIGDKVRITDVETNMEKQRGVFATVCKIEKEGNYWSLTVMPDNDKHTYFIEREEEFEFVPLTPEILEKNGMHLFNRKTNSLMEPCNHSDCFDEDENFRVELSLDRDGGNTMVYKLRRVHYYAFRLRPSAPACTKIMWNK